MLDLFLYRKSTIMLKRRPLESEYEGFCKTYIDKTEGDDICQMLTHQLNDNLTLYKSLTEEQWNHKYEQGKWSIKDILLHIIDTERVFDYRAMRISRGDSTALPGFDQDVFAKHAQAESRSSKSLVNEYDAMRRSTILLFENMSDEACIRKGQASNLLFTPIGLAFMNAGHENHHIEILKERYLNQ